MISKVMSIIKFIACLMVVIKKGMMQSINIKIINNGIYNINKMTYNNNIINV